MWFIIFGFIFFIESIPFQRLFIDVTMTKVWQKLKKPPQRENGERSFLTCIMAVKAGM